MTAFVPVMGAFLVSGGTILLMVWMVIDFLRRRQHANTVAELHARLLERITSTRDLADFMNSDGGHRFLDSLALQREDTPQHRALRSMSAGIVLTVLGIGLAMYTGEIPSAKDFALGVGFLSAVALSLGIGLLAATWATVKLSRRLGLLDAANPSVLNPHQH